MYKHAKKKRCIDEVIYNGKQTKSKIWIGSLKVKLKKIKNDLTVVVIKSEKYENPMYLLTNLRCSSKRGSLRIYRKYLQRWGVETVIRAIKENYQLEDVRLLKYKGLKNMVSLVILVMHLLGKIVYKVGNKTKFIKERIIKSAGRIKKTGSFLYYAVAEGCRIIISRVDKKPIFYPTAYRCQYSLFQSY